MKNLYALLLLFSLTTAYAQTDTTSIRYGEETGVLDTFALMDISEYVFMTRVPTKHLLKFPLLGLVPVEGFDRFYSSPIGQPFVEYERKLGDNLSLNTALAFSMTISSGDGDNSSYVNNLGVSLEPRLYLGMRSRIENGLSADNLSGNYLGLQMGYFRYRSLDPYPGIPGALIGSDDFLPNKGSLAFLFNFGIQRRLLRRGYFDIRLGVGADQRQELDYVYDPALETSVFKTVEGWQPTFNVQVGLGIALGEGRPEEGRLCDALLCFKEEKDLFKVDLINLIRKLDQNEYAGLVTVAYERKLGASPFSVQLDAESLFSWFSLSNVENRLFSWTVALEPRFYYNLRRRMAKGKSGNNLSADYVAIRFSGGQRNLSEVRFEPERIDSDLTYRRFTAMPVWGLQRRIFRNGFIGYQIGIGIGMENNLDTDNTSLLIDSRSRLQVGFAF